MALIDNYAEVAQAVGFDFEVERADDGLVFIVVDGRRRFWAALSHSDRLMFTGILDPEGPL